MRNTNVSSVSKIQRVAWIPVFKTPEQPLRALWVKAKDHRTNCEECIFVNFY